jgi:hypothetical protein
MSDDDRGTWTVTFKGGPAYWPNVLSLLAAGVRSGAKGPASELMARMSEAEAIHTPERSDDAGDDVSDVRSLDHVGRDEGRGEDPAGRPRGGDEWAEALPHHRVQGGESAAGGAGERELRGEGARGSPGDLPAASPDVDAWLEREGLAEKYGLKAGARYEITAGIHQGRYGVLLNAARSGFGVYHIEIVAANLDSMWARPGDLLLAQRVARDLGPGPGRDD